MEYTTRKYPLFSACGLNCGLCPRYHTNGKSKCPGCAGEGFSAVHPPCGILSCCQRKGVEYCFLCGEYPCKKYDGADCSDSFITHKNQLSDFNKAKRIGLTAYEADLNRKVQALEGLLRDYDDGRRKGFYCLAVNLIELPDVLEIMERMPDALEPQAPLKAKAAAAARLFQETADKKGIVLQLCRKTKK